MRPKALLAQSETGHFSFCGGFPDNDDREAFFRYYGGYGAVHENHTSASNFRPFNLWSHVSTGRGDHALHPQWP